MHSADKRLIAILAVLFFGSMFGVGPVLEYIQYLTIAFAILGLLFAIAVTVMALTPLVAKE
ncbi:MAG: hypothetical protein ACFFC0_10010 [Promethearchaeota archaeon]